MKYEAANEFLKKRLMLPTELHSKGIADALPPVVRAHCFFSARVAEARVLQQLRKVSDAFSRGDLGLAEARTQLQKWLDNKGIGDPSSAAITNISSSMRLNLILRQNAAMAAAVGRYQVSRDPDIEERWPSWRYITGSNPRPEHAALNGKIFLKSDPFWKTHYPPWDFGCNCDVEDSDEKPQTPPQMEPSASGYSFDPADAFREFDMSSIEDGKLRKRIASQMTDKLEAIKKAEELKRQQAIKEAHEITKAKESELEKIIEKDGIDSDKVKTAEAQLKSAIQAEAKIKGEAIPDFAPKNKKQIMQKLAATAEKAEAQYRKTQAPEDKLAYEKAQNDLKTAKKMPAAEVKKMFDKSPAQKLVEKIELKKQEALNQANLEAELKKLQLETDFTKTYSGIWKEDIKASDYPEKKHKIKAKKEYFETMLQNHPEQKKKFQGLLNDLADFEKQGKAYEAELETVTKTVRKAEKELQEFRLKNHLQEDLFSQKKKDAAYWFKDRSEADKVLREKCGEIWRNASSEEREAAYQYTAGSGKFNRPLSGFADGWSPSDYKGVGKVDLNHEGAGKMIRDLTDLISKSSYDFDIWLQRGCTPRAIAGPFGCEDLSMMSEKDLQKLVGRTSVINAFVSTSGTKGDGFADQVIMNIYAPRGTKMIYCEPFSHYGYGSKKAWDGSKKQKEFGSEFEVLLQRGGSYTITKIERNGGRIYMDLEIHPEVGYITPHQNDGSKK